MSPRKFVDREPAALLFCGMCQQHYWSDVPHVCSVDPLAAARGIWNALVISIAVGFVVVLFLLVNGWWRWWPA